MIDKNANLTLAEKAALFRQNMGIAETTGHAHNAVGLTSNRDPRKPNAYQNMGGHRHYQNMDGSAGSPMNPSKSQEILHYHGAAGSQTYTFIIENTNGAGATQNAVLFGDDFAPVSGADIVITPTKGLSLASINKDVSKNPVHIRGTRFKAVTDTQAALAWTLAGIDSFGLTSSIPFEPQIWITPDNQQDNLVYAPHFDFIASNRNWISIPIEDGNKVTVTLFVAAQHSSEGIVKGTNTIDVAVGGQ